MLCRGNPVIPICFPSPAAEALVMDPQPGPKGPQPSAAMFAATSDHEVPSSCRLEQENVGKSTVMAQHTSYKYPIYGMYNLT